MKKRIFSIVTAVLMMCTVICYVSPVKTHAASQADALVDIAKSQLGVKERSSGSDDIKYNDWYYGRRVSNSYSGQYAWCAAFVSWCANQAGIPQSIIPKTAGTTNMKDLLIRQGGTAHLRTSGYHPVHGDIIFFGANAGTHVGIVDYTSGNTIYYIDGNNTQTNPHGVHYSSRTFSRTDVWGFVTPNYSGSSSPSARPTNPTIQTSQYWFDLQDTIEVTAHADGATSYFMSFYKDNHLLYQQGVSGGTFRIPASRHGQGKYSAYFSCSNSGGTIDTEWINFEVVGAPAYKGVHVSKSKYDLSDTVEIWVDSVCAKSSVISVFNSTTGQKLLTEKTSNEKFKISAKQLGYGTYSAYFTVVNGSGSTDTKWINFEIAQPVFQIDPTKPIITVDPDPVPPPKDEDLSSKKTAKSITGASRFEKTTDDASFSLGAKAKSKLAYSSDNRNVASVSSSGIVTIKGAGTAIITIKAAETESYESATKTVTIIVKK